MTQKPGAGTKQSSYVKAFQWANLILYMTEFQNTNDDMYSCRTLISQCIQFFIALGFALHIFTAGLQN